MISTETLTNNAICASMRAYTRRKKIKHMPKNTTEHTPTQSSTSPQEEGRIQDIDLAWDMAYAGKPHRDDIPAVKALVEKMDKNPATRNFRAHKAMAEAAVYLLEDAEAAEGMVYERHLRQVEDAQRNAQIWEQGLLQARAFIPELPEVPSGEPLTEAELERVTQEFCQLITETLEEYPDDVQSKPYALLIGGPVPVTPRGRREGPDIESHSLTLVAPAENDALILVKIADREQADYYADITLLQPVSSGDKAVYDTAMEHWDFPEGMKAHPGKYITHLTGPTISMMSGERGVSTSIDGATTRRVLNEDFVSALRAVIDRGRPVDGVQSILTEELNLELGMSVPEGGLRVVDEDTPPLNMGEETEERLLDSEVHITTLVPPKDSSIEPVSI